MDMNKNSANNLEDELQKYKIQAPDLSGETKLENTEVHGAFEDNNTPMFKESEKHENNLEREKREIVKESGLEANGNAVYDANQRDRNPGRPIYGSGKEEEPIAYDASAIPKDNDDYDSDTERKKRETQNITEEVSGSSSAASKL